MICGNGAENTQPKSNKLNEYTKDTTNNILWSSTIFTTRYSGYRVNFSCQKLGRGRMPRGAWLDASIGRNCPQLAVFFHGVFHRVIPGI